MSITKNTHLDRILITFNSDGSFKGAHKEGLEVIKDGDDVIAKQQLPAQSILEADLSGVLPDKASLLADLQKRDDELRAITIERDDLASRVAENGDVK